jgi:glycosyltransferase involved in cell wall biosynthesis
MKERKIIFEHHRALGDCLMFTSGIRDFKLLFPHCRINVKTNFPYLWLNNPYIDKDVKMGDPDVEFYNVGYPIIQHSNRTFNHFSFAFLLDMITQADAKESLGISIGEFCSSFSGGRCGDGEDKLFEGKHGVEPFLTYRNRYRDITKYAYMKRPDVHLSQEEKSNNLVKKTYGIEKYWVIAPGGKSDCVCKIWDWRRFQRVVDYFKDYLTFVVIGKHDHIVEPLNGVISLVDKLEIREIFPLVYHSEGCVSGVSFLMHLAAGIPIERNGPACIGYMRPCVSIYGGRECVSFTCYEGHQILHTIGALSCCDNGGCWQSRVIPIFKSGKKPKDEDGCNKKLCTYIVKDGDRTIQKCMDMIKSEDVIRAINYYYDGDLFKLKHIQSGIEFKNDIQLINKDLEVMSNENKEINVLASLKSQGGGEQSIIKIVRMLREDGWKVNFYPWCNVHKNYKDIEVCKESFTSGMKDVMKPGIPLLFYANDNISDFCNKEKSDGIVEKSSSIVIGINYVNGKLPKSSWMSKKVKAIIFQNNEKKNEFSRDAIGFENTKLIVLFGAIDLDRFLEIYPQGRKENDEMVVLKHCTPDYRKYVTLESANMGDKVHLWQKYIAKDPDIKFYARLLSDVKNVRFEFMEAHPELVEAFKDEKRMIFHKWDSMPVEEFLKRGHVYLYRSSNAWRDQYPRVVAEALSVGLPILSEPRDGTYDRIVYGDTGFYCVDYDSYAFSLKLLYRKEPYRFNMGNNAKSWAKDNLNPRKWISLINSLLIF